MATPLPLELLAGMAAATLTIAMFKPGAPVVAQPDASAAPGFVLPPAIQSWLKTYLLGQGALQSLGLLLLRLAVGAMMIHHGQDKIADPQGFATNYVAALHLPFPVVMAYAAGPWP